MAAPSLRVACQACGAQLLVPLPQEVCAWRPAELRIECARCAKVLCVEASAKAYDAACLEQPLPLQPQPLVGIGAGSGPGGAAMPRLPAACAPSGGAASLADQLAARRRRQPAGPCSPLPPAAAAGAAAPPPHLQAEFQRQLAILQQLKQHHAVAMAAAAAQGQADARAAGAPSLGGSQQQPQLRVAPLPVMPAPAAPCQQQSAAQAAAAALPAASQLDAVPPIRAKRAASGGPAAPALRRGQPAAAASCPDAFDLLLAGLDFSPLEGGSLAPAPADAAAPSPGLPPPQRQPQPQLWPASRQPAPLKSKRPGPQAVECGALHGEQRRPTKRQCAAPAATATDGDELAASPPITPVQPAGAAPAQLSMSPPTAGSSGAQPAPPVAPPTVRRVGPAEGLLAFARQQEQHAQLAASRAP